MKTNGIITGMSSPLLQLNRMVANVGMKIRMLELQADEERAGIEPEAEGAINLPTMEVARTFSVETIDYPHPLGVHQVHRWTEEQMPSLDEWCPEYKMVSTHALLYLNVIVLIAI